MKGIQWIVVAVATAGFASGCVDRGRQEDAKKTAEIVTDPAVTVSVQPIQTRRVAETAEITGSIATGEDSAIGAKNSGRLVSVFVKDGSVVAAGQVIAVQDTSLLQTQLQQANAGVRTALSQLQQATSNANLSPQRSAAAVRQAQSSLRAARVNLQKLENLARPQERRQAEAQVASARSNLDTQQKELARVAKLVAEGALAQNRLDQQQNAVNQAQSAYDSAVQALSLLNEGARAEDLAAAREQVRQAQEAVNTAIANQRLDVTLQDQVRSAQSQVDSARANVRLIQQQIEDATIRAPFAGTISGSPAQPGTVLGPGATVARLVSSGRPFFQGQMPEQLVGQVTLGTPVRVRVDALNLNLAGRLVALNPLGSESARQFSARIELDSLPGTVKPGMFARGQVDLRVVENALVVPASAVVTRDGKPVVFTVSGDSAKLQPVRTGIRDGEWQEVSGLPSGVRIVVSGQESLDEGTKVTVEEKSAAKPGGAQG